MLGRFVMWSAVGLATVSPLAAQQEPRTPARSRIWINRPLDLLAERRARLGVTLNMRSTENDSIGATIQSVTPGGPAAKAGLRSGDIITRFNGRPLVRAERTRVERDDRERLRAPERDHDRDRGADRDRDREPDVDFDGPESVAGVRLVEMVAKLEPGDTVTLEYRRGKNDVRTAQVVTAKETGFGGGDGIFSLRSPDDGEPMIRRLPRMPEGPGAWTMAFGGRFADLELAPVNSELGAYFGTSEGVLVISVPPKNSLGLKSGDVILSVDGRQPRGPASLLRILRTYEEGDVIKLELMRNKSRTTISSKIGRDEED